MIMRCPHDPPWATLLTLCALWHPPLELLVAHCRFKCPPIGSWARAIPSASVPSFRTLLQPPVIHGAGPAVGLGDIGLGDPGVQADGVKAGVAQDLL